MKHEKEQRVTKVVILAGGLGTRLEEETIVTPKPLVTIGGKPMLWHIMKIYSHYGYKEFIICLGYKGHLIKEYFANYLLYNFDVTIDFTSNQQKMAIHSNDKLDRWKVTLAETGLHTQTGGRIQRIFPYVKGETFMLTYGDGVADVDLNALVDFHKSHGKIATLTGVIPPSPFGVLDVGPGTTVKSFREKPLNSGSWVNGGFFVLEPDVFDYIKEGDSTVWEKEPLDDLASDGQLMVYFHHGFWKCMDTHKEKLEFEEVWNSGNPPWKIWKDEENFCK